ncbi:sigma-70 family RNA polymerase sigma factor [Ktedonosporobacter rubrisoli]|uniref:Sigma-70 family RNA polymerase sigma factor n=1 Tax=Ktedonosporobacter rubrisoli TaxID=2509675 RepID=A0A4P6JVC8_KTERU|nr:sigma-70 family RNA polymerase sigma factor [Ktedonosporobacter rubrisoli]QBD79607.1 sigma-70 family RNA polymerase sigma factor [Ktedonosporobacter rubrisoli]
MATLKESDVDSLCARLYRLCAPGILAYLHQHAPTHEDAEDLLFDVFLVALEQEARLAGMREEEQRAWLMTVARNKMIDHSRWLRRRHFLPLEKAESVLDSSERMPEEALVRDEEYTHLRAYLRNLTSTQQEVLQLRFMAGLRCAEIASVLNKREGAIRTMLSRALNTVRGFYRQKGEGNTNG